MSQSTDYCPSWVSPPGETLRELALKKGYGPSELSTALGLSHDDLSRVLNGELPITSTRAERIAALLGPSQKFWVNRESQYRRQLQVIQEKARQWVSSLPLNDMAKFGWVNPVSTVTDRIQQALKFFGMANVDEWCDLWLSERAGLTAYRTSPVFTANGAAVAAWLRQGEIAASHLPTGAWSRSDFKRLLPELRPLTRNKAPSDFISQLQQKCSACGVAVVIVRAPKGCPASGATRFKNGQAIIQLSMRYLRDDSFWFTFFHEAGHLVLHDERLFLEWSEERSLDELKESEANEYAKNILIPPGFETQLRELPRDYKAIMRFARDLHISPGIVVGQLQHRGLVSRDRLNYLKKSYSWDEVL